MSRYGSSHHPGPRAVAVGAILLLASPTAWGWSNGSAPGSAITPIHVPGGSGQLRNDAAASWNTMRLYFKKHHRDIYPAGSLSSYRTFAMQVRAKQLFGSNAATPGTSNHGWGLAVDLATTSMRHNLDRWGSHFGWAKRWSDASWEWWHIKYRAGVWRKRPNPGTSSVYPTMRRGSGGKGQAPYVESLRRNLRKWGYNVHRTGAFGKGLARVVKEFQKDRGLKRDGIVGKNTWKKLKSKPKKKPHPTKPKPKPSKPAQLARPGTVPDIKLAPDGTKTITIAFRNLGRAIWTPNQTFLMEPASNFKVAIDAKTKPNEVGEFVFNVHVPKGASSGSILEKLAVYDNGKKVPKSDIDLKVTVK